MASSQGHHDAAPPLKTVQLPDQSVIAPSVPDNATLLTPSDDSKTIPFPPMSDADAEDAEDQALFSKLQVPRVRYDVEVVTRLIVYTGQYPPNIRRSALTDPQQALDGLLQWATPSFSNLLGWEWGSGRDKAESNTGHRISAQPISRVPVDRIAKRCAPRSLRLLPACRVPLIRIAVAKILQAQTT